MSVATYPKLGPLFALALAMGALAIGCRGIVGIDDLTLVDAGGDGAADAGNKDASPADSGVDASPADSGVDSGGACGAPTNTMRGACEMCCGSLEPMGFGAFQVAADQASTCACTACPNCSTNKVCGGSATAMMTMCLGCIVGTMVDGTCADITNKCQADTNCRKYAACVADCKPLPQ